MSIGSVNSANPNFTARTEKGNDYDKTCAGKVVAGFFVGRNIIRGIIRHSITNDKFVKTISSNIEKSNNSKIKLENFNKFVQKNGKAMNAAGFIGAIIGTVGLFGIGALVDKMINNKRMKTADKAE